MTNIFEERDSIKPYEYNDLKQYIDAIHKSFWTVDEFNFSADLKEFKVDLTNNEKEAIKRCMLAISHIENRVKAFWSDIGKRMPKTEIANVGHVFGGNEVIHQLAYSELLSKLGLESEFENLHNIPCMDGRNKYLKKYSQGIRSRSDKEFTKSLILFTLLVENVSLFSQFLIISSFYKHKNKLLNISKVIQASAREEAIHGMFGSHLINIIKKENPEWFDDEMLRNIKKDILKAYDAECDILDWIFEKSELDFIPKECVTEFLKERFNYSLELIGYDNLFKIDENLLECSEFFVDLINVTSDFDFFTARSTDYNKGQNFDIDELF